MSDVSGAQVLEAIGEATKDLRAKLATAQARIAELEAALAEARTACPQSAREIGEPQRQELAGGDSRERPAMLRATRARLRNEAHE